MSSPMETAQVDNQEAQGVHFASHDEEISPSQSVDPELHAVQTVTGKGGTQRDDLNEAAEQELQQLKTTLKNNMQEFRMQNHAFEPVSLPGSQPASRVCIGLTCLLGYQTDFRSLGSFRHNHAE